MIAQFQSGQKITDYFVLRHKEIRTKKGSNESFLSLELGDSSGRIFGSLWGDIENLVSTLEIGHLGNGACGGS